VADKPSNEARHADHGGAAYLKKNSCSVSGLKFKGSQKRSKYQLLISEDDLGGGASSTRTGGKLTSLVTPSGRARGRREDDP